MSDTRRADHSRRVAAYCEVVDLETRLLWTDSKNLGLHLGYWDEQTRTHREALTDLNRVLAVRVALRPGQRVLDAGCGVGGSSIWMDETYGVKVLGITLSARQPRWARGYAAQRQLGRLTDFAVQDYTAMALDNAAFDVFWALESQCHALNTREFLSEAYRVLKPGGRLVVADGFRKARPYSLHDERLLQSWLSGWTITDLDTCDEFLTSLREVGFTEIHFEDVTERIRPNLQRLYWPGLWAAPMARVLRRLRLLSTIRAQNAEGTHALHRVVRRSLRVYAIFSAQRESL